MIKLWDFVEFGMKNINKKLLMYKYFGFHSVQNILKKDPMQNEIFNNFKNNSKNFI